MNYEAHLGHPPDFEVRYRMYSEAEGGRKSGLPWQHLRCDWAYEGDDISQTGMYMIWPEFVGEDGNVLPEKVPVLPEGTATMWVVVPEMREVIHRSRIQVGVRGYFMEGPRKIAEAVVTQLIGLATNPVKNSPKNG